MSTSDTKRGGNGAGGRQGERVLVTGAGGCVGAFLVEELLAAGAEVVATDRPGVPPPGARPNLTWKPADLTQSRVAPELTRGVDAVIHAAAWVDIAVPFAEQAPINLYAVRSLYEAAAVAGVPYFLHFSTGSLYAPKEGPLDEDDPLLPTSGYEQAKLLAEDYLRTRRDGPVVNLVRPALIYGPRGRVLLAPLATLPVILGGLSAALPRLRGGPRTNVVHGHDVARAAVHLWQHRQPHGATFNVATEEVLAAGELLDTVLEVSGLSHGALEVPYPDRLVRAVLPLLNFPGPFVAFNAAAGALWRYLARRHGLTRDLQPRVDMEATGYLGGNTVFAVSRLLATGFTFRYPTFWEGWQDTMRWYEDHHWVPRSAPAEPTGAGSVEEGATS